MGRLTLFADKRLDVAPDDLYIGMAYLIILRLLWIPTVATFLGFIYNNCELRLQVSIYVMVSIGLYSFCLLNECTLFFISLSGTVSNPNPRRHTSKFSHLELFLMLLDLGWNIYGIYAVYYTDTCSQIYFPRRLLEMVPTWGVITDVLFFLIVMVLLKLSRKKARRNDFAKYMDLWKRRINYLFSGPHSRQREGIQVVSEVAHEMADFFQDLELDWAPSDIAVGMILLKREQKLVREVMELQRPVPTKGWKFGKSHFYGFKELRDLRQSTTKMPEGQPRISLESSGRSSTFHFEKRIVPRETSHRRQATFQEIKELTVETKFNTFPRISKIDPPQHTRVSTYTPMDRGWDLQTLPAARSPIRSPRSEAGTPISAMSQLPSDILSESITKEDIWDILHFSHYSKLAYVEIDPNRNFDLLLSRSAKNDLFHSPFMISFDHDWKAIVIAIRGTNSAVDVLVDLKIDLAPLETGTPFMAHSGMLETARNIVRKLLDENFLETYRSDEYKNYRIVVCGHSLGAGVAALVGYYLRKKHASVRVYAYEAPGGLLNESGASLFDDFCVTVVCGDDLVPRLSRYCMDLLKADLIRILKNCQEPKYKIIHSVIGNLFKVSEKTKAIIGKDPEAAKRNMEKIQKETSSLPQSWRGEQTAQHVSQATPTFMPGRILYLEKLREFDRSERDDQAKEPSKQRKGNQSLNKLKEQIQENIEKIQLKKDFKYVYVPRWTDRKEFHQIIVSRTMLTDHVPWSILQEFEDAPSGVYLRTTS